MVVLFCMSVICVLLAFYASRDEIPFGLEICFCIIAFFAAIHYNYGNDYESYAKYFYDFSNMDFTWEQLLSKKIYKDYGWVLLNYVFRPFDFLSLVAFLGVFQNLIYYFFVKHFVPKEWWWLGVFTYLFFADLYVLNMSMMRQGLAASLFVLAFFCIQKLDVKKIIVAIVLVFIASKMHGSAVILYPCLLLVFLKKEWAPFFTIPLGLLLFLLFLKPDLVNNFLLSLEEMENVEDFKQYYELSSARSFSIGIIWRLLPFFVSSFCCVFYKDFSDKEVRTIVLSMIGFVMIPFSLIIPMIGRLCYFFTPFMIASVPMAYCRLPNPYRNILLGLFILNVVYGYWGFFHNDTWFDAYYTFHSVFDILF